MKKLLCSLGIALTVTTLTWAAGGSSSSSECDPEFVTNLMTAVGSFDVAQVESILSTHAEDNPDLIHTSPQSGCSPLVGACYWAHKSDVAHRVVEALLEYGADMRPTSEGKTPLHILVTGFASNLGNAEERQERSKRCRRVAQAIYNSLSPKERVSLSLAQNRSGKTAIEDALEKGMVELGVDLMVCTPVDALKQMNLEALSTQIDGQITDLQTCHTAVEEITDSLSSLSLQQEEWVRDDED